MATKLTSDDGGKAVASVLTDAQARDAAASRAEEINGTYSLAGADLSKEEAGQVGVVTLSEFDLYEAQKMYGVTSRDELLAAMQRGAEQAAEDRLRRLADDQQNRADVIGGLAIRGLIDVTDGTDLDDLPTDIKLGLPWHLRHTGPRGNGVTVVRKSWSAEDAMRAAKVAGWGVRAVASKWDDEAVGAGETDEYRTIVRQAIPEYAEDCRCDGFHGRPGEPHRWTEAQDDGTYAQQPLCAWLTSKALGQCKRGWKADVQVEDYVDVLAAFTNDGAVELETIGWLSGGTKVFMQMRLSDTAYVLGTDPWKVYLGIHVNFSGMGANTIHTSGVRDLCDNTRKWAERTATGLARVAHVGNMQAQMVDAGRFILEAQGFVREEQRIAETLAKIELTMADFNEIAEAVYDDKEVKTDQGRKALESKRAAYVGHLLSDDTLPADLRRTGYGAREATNRWFGQIVGTLDRSDTARLNSVWDSSGPAMANTRKVTKIAQTIGGRRVKVTT